MRRTLRLVVHDRDAVVAAVTALQPATLVVDVQPFVAPWGCSPDSTLSGAIALSRHLAEAAPKLSTLVFATNARSVLSQKLQEERPQVTLVSAACKPWRIGYLAVAPRPVVVIGDQVVTDGLLAHRLHGQFLHWQAHCRIPWWPRLQATIGYLLVKIMFSSMGQAK
jgi:predicted HAD superfamily phosphohydrolase YqeG